MARALAAWTWTKCFAAAINVENGTIGTLEATRFSGGHKDKMTDKTTFALYFENRGFFPASLIAVAALMETGR